jgi:hypothetical protein
MDPYLYLLVVVLLLLAFGGVVAFMAHRERVQDEGGVHDVAAE